jgi:hypothetical protein
VPVFTGIDGALTIGTAMIVLYFRTINDVLRPRIPLEHICLVDSLAPFYSPYGTLYNMVPTMPVSFLLASFLLLVSRLR